MVLHPLAIIGLILVAGYVAGRAANYFLLPQISGYILAGLVFSPSITGFFDLEQVDSLFGLISEIALAVIAYSIGGSLQIRQVRVLGRAILWINFAQGISAFICTSLAVYAAGHFLSLFGGESGKMFACIVLIFGGISIATAPAATMAVIHELRAKGPLTTTLLGVVALDDALSIISFSCILVIAGQLLGVDAGSGTLFLKGLVEIVGALIAGVAGGIIFSFFLNLRNRPEINLMVTLGAIFLVSGLSINFGFSPLLANMMMGFVIINKVRHADDLFHQLDIIEETIFCLFFSLAAAHFDVNALATSSLLGLILFAGRFIGKLSGTYIGGKFSRASKQVYQYLGITLLPQAGLSLGLIFFAKPMLPAEIFDVMLSAMLASIILNEIISPPLVKWTLSRVGESNPEW